MTQTLGFEKSSVWVDSRPHGVALFSCTTCDATLTLRMHTGKPIVPEALAKQARQRGWVVDHRFASATRCPRCRR